MREILLFDTRPLILQGKKVHANERHGRVGGTTNPKVLAVNAEAFFVSRYISGGLALRAECPL